MGCYATRIPLFARIIAIADAFTALTMDRPYRRRMRKDEAIRTLQDGAGTQWDADLVERFLRVLEETGAQESAREARAG